MADLTQLSSYLATILSYSQSISMKKLFIIPLLVLLISCQPTKITQSWAAKDVVPKQYKKVLVLGVFTDNDNKLQTKMENHVADDLRGLGYLAIAANKGGSCTTTLKNK